MIDDTRPIGVVLSGGAGRRLGRTKGDLVLAGTPLALRAAQALAPLCRRVVISVRPGEPSPQPQRYVGIEDTPPSGRGPLAGLCAAFEAIPHADLLVLACDYPNVEPALLIRLLGAAEEDDELVFPVDRSGRDHPLVGLWRRSLAGRVARALDEQRHAVRDLVARVRTRRLSFEQFAPIGPEDVLLNVNRPEDLARFEARNEPGPDDPGSGSV